MTEESIHTRTEALVDHIIVLTGGIAYGAPLGLHRLDLICGLGPSSMSRQDSIDEELFDLDTDIRLSLEVLLLCGFTLVVELLVTLV